MSAIRVVAFLAMVFASVAVLCSQSHGRQGGRTQGKPIVILAEIAKGRVVYEVDSKPALPDLLSVLGSLEEQRGKDCPVIALIDSRAPISEFGNIDGTAGKAQLTNIRYFAFTPGAGRMSEIRWLPSVPYSTDPPMSRDPLNIR
jgi:hypothetical protein